MRNCSFAMFLSSICLHLTAIAGASACDGTELLQHVTLGGSQSQSLRPKLERKSSLMQHWRPPTNRTEAGLHDLAEHLRRAKGECLRSSVECLPALKQAGGSDTTN